MTRRDALVGLLLAAVAVPAPPAADAQEAAKIPRIGVLFGGTSLRSPTGQALQDGLRALGYVDGQNIRIEFRSAEGKLERLPALAAELVALKPDVIVSSNTPTTRALKDRTRTIPVVMVAPGDPVALGAVCSAVIWRRPGSISIGRSHFTRQ
jgi:putative ABC transport system substrate-binding protein